VPVLPCTSFFSNVLEAKSGSLLSSSVFAAALAMSVSLDVGGRRHHAGLPHGHHFPPLIAAGPRLGRHF
jgi:hypothetical protein